MVEYTNALDFAELFAIILTVGTFLGIVPAIWHKFLGGRGL